MMEDQRMSWIRRSPESPVAHTTFRPSQNANKQIRATNDRSEQMADIDAFNSYLNAILQHAQLGRFGTIILTYLRVDDETFRAVCHLRNESLFAHELHPFHPSIFVSPPRDLWDFIVQLRRSRHWGSFRTHAIQQLKKHVIDQLYAQQETPDFSAYSSNLSRSLSAAPSSTDEEAEPPPSPRHVASAQPQRKMNSDKSRKIAPTGQRWQCPSRGCKRLFQKRGHFDKHVEKWHPDFRTCHPNFNPDQYLRPASTDKSPSREIPSGVPKRSNEQVHLASNIPPPQLKISQVNVTRAPSISISSSASVSSPSNAQSATSSDIPRLPDSAFIVWPGDLSGGFDATTAAQDVLTPHVFDANEVPFSTHFDQGLYYTDEQHQHQHQHQHQTMELELQYPERLSVNHRTHNRSNSSPRPQ